MCTLQLLSWPLRAAAAVLALGMGLLVVGGPFALSALGRNETTSGLDGNAVRPAAERSPATACAAPAGRATPPDDRGV